MWEIFRPRLVRESIHTIDLDDLRRRGIRGLVVDLDNTLVRWNRPEVPASLRTWLARAEEAGFRVAIVSNNGAGRVQAFAAAAGVPAVHKASKPRRGGYRRAMELIGTSAAETAVIGDQIFTDVLGGNRLGLFTILVTPLSQREFFGTRLVRFLERQWLRYLRTRGLI